MTKKTYTTDDITMLEGLDHVRLRTSVYLSGTPRNVATREIIDNAMDEAAKGYGSTVDVVFHDDGSIEVTDNGRGVPVDWNQKHKLNGIIMTLGRKDSGSNFNDDTASAGTNGIGASATNAISLRFDVTVRRDGKSYTQSFKQGKPGVFAGNGFDPFAEFEPRVDKLRGKKDTSGLPTGTSIRWYFDPEIAPDDVLDVKDIYFRIHTSTLLIPGVMSTVTKDGKTVSFGDVLDAKSKNKYVGSQAVYDMLHVEKPEANVSGESTFNGYSKNTPFTWELSAGVPVDISGEATQYGFTNTVYNSDGGSHVGGASSAVYEALEEKAKSLGASKLGLKKSELPPTAKDFEDIVNMVVSVKGSGVQFDSQAKSRVTSPSMSMSIKKSVKEQFTLWLNQKKNSSVVLSWVKVALENKRNAEEIAALEKLSKQRKENKRIDESLRLPEKYIGCRTAGYDSGAELYIVEGDSAMGTIKGARDSNVHAIIPIRGKVKNTYGLPLNQSLQNREISDIVQVIGASVGKMCDPKKSKFSKIILTADADPDGAHINVLLSLMFYTLMRPLIEAGMVYIVHPPLFAIKYKDGKDESVAYAHTDEERDAIIKKIGNNKVTDVARNKGLGEMDADDFENTVLNPDNRNLVQIQLDDVQEIIDRCLSVWFGSDTGLRREHIADINRKQSIEEIREVMF